MWQPTVDGEKLQLTYVSMDGEEGYPGTVTTTVTYEVTADNTLRISYNATCDADTILLLTNHAYFNLSGAVRFFFSFFFLFFYVGLVCCRQLDIGLVRLSIHHHAGFSCSTEGLGQHRRP